ncbi:GPI ethanolamine phosphate transferase 1-like [Physella acuta]|uniref:GPI ethanolamine phosphate transferase 1-like n=1 Tax=Physella acuta TaxID=109671 RepID=UPI0027DD6743|nr:GPI ethanolamine phosphate transferase 1-like [Physella acuta]
MNIWQLVVVGVTVHVIFFYSIFDIYFTSPLVHGMTPISSAKPGPAKRLVLFVTDGLRADKFFEPDEGRAPFMREIIEKHGVWGVSHTRVPTESRPGHVALIAGFYEDVSAVAKGWKENPVEFDSVFNESRQTWSWGSPDILPMFAKGASGNHVVIHCYPSNLEDFAGADMTKLDTWVFEEVEKFFAAAKTNASLKDSLENDKIVFFFHLLGIDTHGHSQKPHSWAYLNNIKLVDKGIKDMVALIENFYNHDKQTSYVMTSDHGMTDWGSHGAGHAHETLTPFVAWGAGIRKPVVSSSCGNYDDSFCTDWKLHTVKRTDIEQADIAPLMSFLVGVPYPLNSVGKLPVDFLEASDGDKAEALFANAKQILAQFQVKMDQVKQRSIGATFKPFPELIEPEKLQAVKHIQNLIHNGQFHEAMKETYVLIEKALRGLRYYQTYDRFFLGVSIVLGFLGWMNYILYLLVLEHTKIGQSFSLPQCSPALKYFFSVLGASIVLLLYVQSLSPMCYIYCLLPVILWYKSCQGWSLLAHAVRTSAKNKTFLELTISLLFCVVGLELVIQSFYHRELLSIGLLAMSAWPLVKYSWHEKFKRDKIISLGWFCTCLTVAVFPLLPVVHKDTHYNRVITSGIFSIILAIVGMKRFLKHVNYITKCLWILQIVLVTISVGVVKLTSDSILQKQGLPFVCQCCSWSVLVLSSIIPMFSPTNLIKRLFSLSLAFIAPYLLLSITYEGFFILSLYLLLYFWLKMEHAASSTKSFEQVDFSQQKLVKDNLTTPFSRHLELPDLRRAFLFIFFILTAFFGTGNIASINSFDPASVYCYLTVFNPFLMGGLMMLKNVIPFLVVTCAFRAVHVLTATPLRSLFLIVLIMSDFMGLHFFFMVRDYGSWLEIGTTISHYVIVMLMNIFLLLLTGASHALTCWKFQLF